MPKTPGQLFVEQFFGGIQRGVEGLPRAVRQNRLDERQRNRDSFTQLLNVERVTQAFRDQELREERNQQALLQTAGRQETTELIGQIFQAQSQEANPPFIEGSLSGPLIEQLPGALGRADPALRTSFNIQSQFQPEQKEDGIPSFEQTDVVASKIRQGEPLTASDFDVLDRANRKVTDFELKEGEKAPKPTKPDVNVRQTADRIRRELVELDKVIGTESGKDATGLLNESEIGILFDLDTDETRDFFKIKEAIDKLLRGPAGGSALLQRIQSAFTSGIDINAQTELSNFLRSQGIEVAQSTLDKIFAKARQVGQPQPARVTGSNNDLISERERLLKQLK